MRPPPRLMPLRSKVKRRIRRLFGFSLWLLLPALGAQVIGSAACPGIGERAVSAPGAPVVVPPILQKATPKEVVLRVNLKTQRLQLLVAGEVAIDTPVTTGRKDLETPAGKFLIESKEARRKPNGYGNLVDARGKVVVAGVYRSLDPIPRGLRFEPVERDFLITVEGQGFTIHAGTVRSLPVSDGAILLPAEIARLVFSKVAAGVALEILAE